MGSARIDTATASSHGASLPEAPPRGFLRRHALKFAASFIITCGIVFTIHKGGLKLLPEGGDFQHVRPWTLPAYFGTPLHHVLVPERPVALPAALHRRRPEEAPVLGLVRRLRGHPPLAISHRRDRAPVHDSHASRRARGPRGEAHHADGGDELRRRRADRRRPVSERRPRSRALPRADGRPPARPGRRDSRDRRPRANERLRDARSLHGRVHHDRRLLLRAIMGSSRHPCRRGQGVAKPCREAS